MAAGAVKKDEAPHRVSSLGSDVVVSLRAPHAETSLLLLWF
jgi:hypothetical protein